MSAHDAPSVSAVTRELLQACSLPEDVIPLVELLHGWLGKPVAATSISGASPSLWEHKLLTSGDKLRPHDVYELPSQSKPGLRL